MYAIFSSTKLNLYVYFKNQIHVFDFSIIRYNRWNISYIPEIQVQESFCRLYYKLKHQSIPILEQMLTSLQLIRNRRMLWSPDIVALNKRISDLSSQNQTLAFLKQQGLVDPDIFIAKTKVQFTRDYTE